MSSSFGMVVVYSRFRVLVYGKGFFVLSVFGSVGRVGWERCGLGWSFRVIAYFEGSIGSVVARVGGILRFR